MLFAATETVSTNSVETAAGPAASLSGCVGAQLSEGRELVNQIVEWLTHEGLDFALRVVVSALILLVGWIAIRIICAAVTKAVTRGGRKRTLFTNFIASVVSKVCWAVLIIMVLGRLGVDIAPLVAGLGVTGFIVGFACQESLGNLASGMMIAVNEPFKVGDFVNAGGHEGSVIEVNMMATVLATGDNKRITIPNKSAWGGPIVNYNALGLRRVDLQVGIGYGEDIERALAVIGEAVRGVPGVLTDPEPSVGVAGLDNSAVVLRVRPWSRSGDYWNVASATLQAVKEALERNGIEIPFPQLVVRQAR